jgi:hypothetical protein
MAGLVPAIDAAPLPANFGTSCGSATSPNAIAFGRMTGTSPVMTAMAPLSSCLSDYSA